MAPEDRDIELLRRLKKLIRDIGEQRRRLREDAVRAGRTRREVEDERESERRVPSRERD